MTEMQKKKQNNKNVPNLRFKGFEGEWIETTLGDCSQSLDYGMNAAAVEFDGENKYIRITDIDESTSKYISDLPVSPEGELEEKYLVKENDILFARTGASTGKTYLYHIEDGKLYFAGFLIRAKINSTNNACFIFNQTKTSFYNKWVKLTSMRSGQPGINSQEYASFRFWIPSKQEQDKIASFLSLLDGRIQTQNKIIAQLQTLMRGLGEQLFKQQVRFRDDKGNDFPEWEEKFGNEVFENISDKNHNSDLPILAITQEHGAIPRDLIDYNITVTEKSIESYKVVQVGDFIISLRSFQGGIEYSKYKGICSPAYIILRATIPINKIYFKYYLKTDKYITELNKKLEGIRDGKMISYAYFSEIPLLIPSIQEQTLIANFLSLMDEKTETEKKILQQYENQKKYLLQNMFI